MVVLDIMYRGRVTEWFKEPVLKTGAGQPAEGSNPSPSARILFLIFHSSHSGLYFIN